MIIDVLYMCNFFPSFHPLGHLISQMTKTWLLSSHSKTYNKLSYVFWCMISGILYDGAKVSGFFFFLRMNKWFNDILNTGSKHSSWWWGKVICGICLLFSSFLELFCIQIKIKIPRNWYGQRGIHYSLLVYHGNEQNLKRPKVNILILFWCY